MGKIALVGIVGTAVLESYPVDLADVICLEIEYP